MARMSDLAFQLMTYREGNEFFHYWRYPKYTPMTKIYVYNFTNAEEFVRGDAKKLRVEELGPFTYRCVWVWK